MVTVGDSSQLSEITLAMKFKVNSHELAKVNNIFGENVFPNDVLKVPHLENEDVQQPERESSICDALEEMNMTDEGESNLELTRNAVTSLNDPRLL